MHTKTPPTAHLTTAKEAKMTLMRVKEERVETTKIVVRDAVGRPVSFLGVKMVDLSWDARTATSTQGKRRPTTRWTDMVLYQVTDPNVAYEYVLWVVGRSVVYHKPDGRCQRGVPMNVGKLIPTDRYAVLAACPTCRPDDLDDLDEIDMVSVEDDRYTLHLCADAEALIEALEDKRDGSISGLAIRLLNNAAEIDPAIQQAMQKERTL